MYRKPAPRPVAKHPIAPNKVWGEPLVFLLISLDICCGNAPTVLCLPGRLDEVGHVHGHLLDLEVKVRGRHVKRAVT